MQNMYISKSSSTTWPLTYCFIGGSLINHDETCISNAKPKNKQIQKPLKIALTSLTSKKFELNLLWQICLVS